MDASAAPEAGPARLAPEAFAERARRIETEIGKVIVGQQELVRHTLVGLLANGHVLLEGVPGLGKTMLVRTIGDVIDCTFNRIQFTPDLMPADITGTNILVEEGGSRVFKFQPGPDLRQPRPRRRDQPRDAEDPVGAARGDAGAPGHGRAQPLPRSTRRSSSSRPRTRSRWRAPIRCPRRSSTGSCSRRWSRSRPRRTSSRSSTARRAPTRRRRRRSPRPPRSSRCSASPARCPIAPHITDYAVSLLAATHPDNRRAPGLARAVRPLRRLAARRAGPGHRRQDPRAHGRPLQRLDRRRPRRGAAGAPPPRDPQLRGRGRGHHHRGRRPRDPGRGGAARRRVADPAPCA